MSNFAQTSSILIDYAFFQSWVEALDYPGLSNDELETMRKRLIPLIEDAIIYYMDNDGEAPILAEPQ